MADDPQKNLDKFINETFKRSLTAGLEKLLQSIENDAKQECPYDDGILRADITHIVDKDDLEGVVGNNIEYAPYVHQGTGIYAKKGNGRKTPWSYQTADGKWHTTKGQEPKPYLQNAIDKNAKNALKAFGEGAEVEWKKS